MCGTAYVLADELPGLPADLMNYRTTYVCRQAARRICGCGLGLRCRRVSDGTEIALDAVFRFDDANLDMVAHAELCAGIHAAVFEKWGTHRVVVGHIAFLPVGVHRLNHLAVEFAPNIVVAASVLR